MAIDTAPVWPGGDGLLPRGIVKNVDRAYGPPYPQPGPLIVIGDSITPAVRDRWSKRGIRFVGSDVRVPTNQSAVELRVSAVHMVGPFLCVSVDQHHLTARVNGRGQSWAGGATVYLMRSGTGWTVVGGSNWIT